MIGTELYLMLRDSLKIPRRQAVSDFPLPSILTACTVYVLAS